MVTVKYFVHSTMETTQIICAFRGVSYNWYHFATDLGSLFYTKPALIKEVCVHDGHQLVRPFLVQGSVACSNHLH